jgi:hypothetical protein
MTPRTVPSLLDDAIDLYRERFLLLVSAGALVYIPFQVAYFALSMGPMRQIMRFAQDDNNGDPMAMLTPFAVLLLLFPLQSVAQVLQAATASLVVQKHLAGEVPTILWVAKELGKRVIPLLFSSLLVGILLTLAALLTCGLGAFWVMVLTAFVSQGLMLERRGLRDSFRRSVALGKGYGGRVLGLLLLTGGLVAVFSLGLSGVLEGIFSLVPLPTHGTLEGEMQEYVIEQVLRSVATLVLAPISGVATTLLYYDHRVRREGIDFDEQARSQNIEMAPDYFGGIGTEK